MKKEFRAWSYKHNIYLYCFTITMTGKVAVQEPGDDYPSIMEKAALEQYVGQKDIKSKKIFEGHICKVHIFIEEFGESMGVIEGEREFIAEIKMSEYGMVLKEGKEETPVAHYSGIHEESFEIIGNIHENRDLLKG